MRLTGAVDIQSVPQLRAQLGELVREATGRVVVDLTDVSFFDSAGLSALDEAQTAAGAHVALVCTDSRILRLFEITGLKDRFVISATVEEAVGP